MHRVLKRLLGGLLSASLLVSVASPTLTAFAQDVPAEEPEQVSQVVPMDPVLLEQRETELAVQAYESLTDEEQEYFERAIASYPELVEYHQSYVNPDYDPSQVAAPLSAGDPVAVLMAEINLLAIPTAVKNAISATGVGMVAAAADGPLPIGDIILAAAAATLAVTCAIYWSTVSPNWNAIVLAFRHAFSNTVNNVISAFNQIRVDILREYYTNVNPVTFNRGNKTITYNGQSYRCTLTAEAAVSQRRIQSYKYYPAIRGYDNKVYVMPTEITADLALGFIFADDMAAEAAHTTGIGSVFTKNFTSAVSLLSGIGGYWGLHDNRNGQCGYWYHVHPLVAQKTHVWFEEPCPIT